MSIVDSGGAINVSSLLSGISPLVAVYDTADANANHAKLLMPAGGAVHVPVLAIADYGNLGVDNGWFNGLVQPELAVIDADEDSYISLTHSADDVAAIVTLTAGGSRTNSITFDELLTTFNGADVVVANGNGMIIGAAAQVTSWSVGDAATTVPELQVLGTASEDSRILIGRWSADALAGGLNFTKSRHGTIGSSTIVVSGDSVVNVTGFADDGVDFQTPVAQIQYAVDGTPGANDMPGRIVVSVTADGASTLSESFRVSNDANIYVANNNGMVVGHTAQVVGGSLSAAELQVLGTASGDAQMLIGKFSNDAAGGYLLFVKSRSATIGSFTTAATNDEGGTIRWSMDDGTDYHSILAEIICGVAGTVGTGVSPGSLLFRTTLAGAETTTLVMTIGPGTDVFIADGHGLIVGHNAQLTLFAGTVPEFQVSGTAASDSSMSLHRSSADATGPRLFLSKSRNAAIGSFTIATANDIAGEIIWNADDGVDYVNPVASIRAEVQTATGSNNLGGKLILATTNDGATVTDAVTIFKTGGVNVGAPTGGDKGVGTLNAVGVYDDNVLLTDWVFDLFFGGTVTKHTGRVNQQRLWSVTDLLQFVEQNHHLPWMPDMKDFEEERSLGNMVTWLWEGQEQQMLHLFNHEARITELETELKLLREKVGV